MIVGIGVYLAINIILYLSALFLILKPLKMINNIICPECKCSFEPEEDDYTCPDCGEDCSDQASDDDEDDF